MLLPLYDSILNYIVLIKQLNQYDWKIPYLV